MTKQRHIDVITNEGTIQVPAEVYGHLAVHARVPEPQLWDRWTITHIPSGRGVVTFSERENARRIARRFGATADRWPFGGADQRPLVDASVYAVIDAIRKALDAERAARWNRGRGGRRYRLAAVDEATYQAGEDRL